MPYAAIGTIIALGMMAYAFYEAENRGRLVILVLASATFIIPELFSTSTIGLICYISRILIGIGCYIYVKIRHA
jgi:ABC-type glycerol-3-phosphate transport system permease component